jgi:16S rRNA (cytidine1402-2'-O)-methyltransferase
MTAKGKLILIPTVIADETQHKVIAPHVKNELINIQHFLVENVRTARRYLSSLKIFNAIDHLHFDVLSKDTSETELPTLLHPINDGKNIGIISESGCPGIADPGALAVKYAHQNNITVVPLVGPSSILLAIMASGLNGQQFSFNGYLPIENKEREKAIRSYEKESGQRKQTQIFIETPYRNNSLLTSLIKNLKPHTELGVALDLTGENEMILTLPVQKWKLKSIDLPKVPAIFLFLSS